MRDREIASRGAVRAGKGCFVSAIICSNPCDGRRRARGSVLASQACPVGIDRPHAEVCTSNLEFCSMPLSDYGRGVFLVSLFPKRKPAV